MVFVDSWHDDPGLVALLADRVRGTDAHVVFTAHSLPARILDEGDPYRDQLLETARLVAESAGVADWSFSFQSESPTGEPWLGPDILDHLVDLRGRGIERRADLPRRLRVGSSGDPLGHRPRGTGQGKELGLAARIASRCRTTTRVSCTFSVRSCAARSPRSPHDGAALNTVGGIVVDRVSRTFPRLPEGAAHAQGRLRLARAQRRT